MTHEMLECRFPSALWEWFLYCASIICKACSTRSLPVSSGLGRWAPRKHVQGSVDSFKHMLWSSISPQKIQFTFVGCREGSKGLLISWSLSRTIESEAFSWVTLAVTRLLQLGDSLFSELTARALAELSQSAQDSYQAQLAQSTSLPNWSVRKTLANMFKIPHFDDNTMTYGKLPPFSMLLHIPFQRVLRTVQLWIENDKKRAIHEQRRGPGYWAI